MSALSTIVIVGPGAIGCLLAATISRDARYTVIMLDHNSERAAFLDQHGIILEEEGKSRCIQGIRVCCPDQLRELPDYIFLTIKGHAVAGALASIRPFSKNAILVGLQNGIGHLAVFSSAIAKYALGVTALGANIKKTGHVVWAGKGETRLGAIEEKVTREELKKIAGIFNAAGHTVLLSKDILADIWGKLFINVGINALTAILNCPNGDLLQDTWARKILRQAVQEAVQVAGKAGISIDGNPVQRTEEICQATATNISSMLQDVRKKKRTEIGGINGAIVALADKYGIDVPVNRMLCRRIWEMEKMFIPKSH